MDLAAYGDKKIVDEMVSFSRAIDMVSVHWHKVLISTDELHDETELFNIGVPTVDQVNRFEIEDSYPS
jgi:hypothetical protein